MDFKLEFNMFNTQKQKHIIPSRPNPRRTQNINFNIYIRSSLWRLKRFDEGLDKTFWGTTKKCEYKNLT